MPIDSPRRTATCGFSHWAARAVCLLPLATCIACSKGDGRVNMSGSVTWKGQSVPAGMILFNPDVKAGNIGPQGMAPIENGRYDTRGTGGRPVTPGAHTATIHGYDGKNIDEDHRRGKRLFMPAEVAVTAPQNSGTVDLVVPDAAEALR